MNETPPPLRVCAITTFGPSASSRPFSVSASAREIVAVALGDRPAEGRSFASRSPRSLTSETHVSDCTSFRSTIIVISCSFRFAVGCSDSQNWPSCSSPSPVRT